MIKKSISISHIPNTFNYGSAMMAIVLIRELYRRSGEELNFYVDAWDEENLSRLRRSTGINSIFSDEDLTGDDYRIWKEKHWLGKSRRQKIYSLPSETCRAIRHRAVLLDALRNKVLGQVVIGGDDLSEYYGIRSLVLELTRIKKFSTAMPMILLGQSVGPFAPSREKLASYCLKQAAIYSRDDRTYDYCKSTLKLPYSYNSRDLAFLDLPMQDEEKEHLRLLSMYGLEKNAYATVVTSGLVSHYTQDTKAFLDNFERVFEGILSRDGVKRILLLPHVVRPKNSDDRLTNAMIVDYIEKKGRRDILDSLVHVENVLMPYEARILLGNGRFTVSGRMHAAVSTFQMGKPAVALSYSVKYNGVLAKGLNVPELVVDAQGTDKWTDYKVAEKVSRSLDYVEKEYAPLCFHIRGKVCEMKEIVGRQLDQVYRHLTLGIGK
ncbi:MAG: polysaccharide pyruvyl transferase family protein [Dethiosulfovibrio sp.]|nr:polysaccharide pyruvyl transferase family protein [Dethiosulfovibrio sp.]